ncbi:hypothetical protein LTSEINV_1902 [Salmonella enterica subsp. enterica serovar Inverness str. R8-3668]|uniref:Uncharacterized protein n=1 Tax=Salmonella enterica subsp. enterica serovar Inverness str. R8-3668 TaxID=913075 RepID=G5NBK6_SALET|nr:hypothetical protein LTSEINV_1902 [Salmonella enterica subsp. enterica serovar Inverness str. R8-3668]
MWGERFLAENLRLILLLCVNFRNPPHFVLIWPLMVAIQLPAKKLFLSAAM